MGEIGNILGAMNSCVVLISVSIVVVAGCRGDCGKPECECGQHDIADVCQCDSVYVDKCESDGRADVEKDSVDVDATGVSDSVGEDVCVEGAGNCDDGNPCTNDWRDGCRCAHSVLEVPWCCQVAYDCPNDDPCIDFGCVDSFCVATVRPITPCREWCGAAMGANHCEADHICDFGWCETATHMCRYAAKPVDVQRMTYLECCESDADCRTGGIWGRSGEPEGMIDVCIDRLCVRLKSPEDCNCSQDEDCLEPDITWGTPSCFGACQCGVVPFSWSCNDDRDCWDNTPNTEDVCIDGRCVNREGPGDICPNDVSIGCDDQNDCTTGKCLVFDGGCYMTTVLWYPCCVMDDDCIDDDLSTEDHCVNSRCVNERLR